MIRARVAGLTGPTWSISPRNALVVRTGSIRIVVVMAWLLLRASHAIG
jgi:hypothetical protein